MKNTGDSYIQCSYHGPLGVYSVCVCVGGGGGKQNRSLSRGGGGGAGGGVVYLQLLSSIGVYC